MQSKLKNLYRKQMFHFEVNILLRYDYKSIIFSKVSYFKRIFDMEEKSVIFSQNFNLKLYFSYCMKRIFRAILVKSAIGTIFFLCNSSQIRYLNQNLYCFEKLRHKLYKSLENWKGNI